MAMLVVSAVQFRELTMHIGKPSMGNHFKEYDAESGRRLREGTDPAAEPLRALW